MHSFYEYDPCSIGTKGLVFIGDQIVVCRRDTNTKNHPLELDLPGGGPEPGETPFETFQREVWEELRLKITREHIQSVRTYPSARRLGWASYFASALLPKEMGAHIQLGDEGVEFLLLSPDEFARRTDAWPIMQERTVDYLTMPPARLEDQNVV